MRVFHRRLFDRWRIDVGQLRRIVVGLYSSEALFELYSDGGIIHIKRVTIGIIIVGTTIIIIIIVIHNVGMCSSIPSRNRTYRGWCCCVGGNQLGEHGLQLSVFLLPSWAIVWVNCRIDNVSIIFNIVVGFIFTVFSGGAGVRDGLN